MILLPLMLLWVRRPLQFAMDARWSFLVAFTIAVFFMAPHGLSVDTSNDRTGTSGASIDKHREGTRVANMVGDFRESGHRWSFMSDSGEVAFQVLENQSLERIARAIGEDPSDRRWKISGVLTEFYDQNFLLINRIERAASVEFGPK